MFLVARRAVEDGAAPGRVRLEEADQERAVAAPDVHDRAERREVIGRRDRDRDEPGDVGHRRVEARAVR
jgi:hypothetical protein